ncbi:MAG: hypothetical protein LBP73_10825 [Clostridiales Family XIII bacterium]|jgi:hypothetical protein|nr:hypothetical protein [Clostridiales Family XIII bacterium]
MNISFTKGRTLSAILILALLFSLLPQTAFSATTEKTTTYYRLDTGVTFLWKNSAGAWQKGWAPGGTQSYGAAFELPRNARNVKVYTYSGSNFDFEKPQVYLWNPTAYTESGRSDYNRNYNNHRANPFSVSGAETYIPANGRLTVTYTATFAESTAYNVKNMLKEDGGKQKIYALLGSPTQELIEAMNLLDPASEQYSPNVEGYLWFLPVIFEYELTERIEIPDDTLDAILDLPASAKLGDAYTAADISEVGADLTVRAAELHMREVGKTAWSPVATWPGRGRGQNSGGRKSEKAKRTGEFEYRLTVTTTDGRSDTDTKRIKIYEGEKPPVEEEEAQNGDPDVRLTAVLALPPTVYEGHAVIAQDQSVYAVDGKLYSADAAYNKFKATHGFKPSPASGAQVVTNYEGVYTDARIAWPTAGDYDVTLRIGLKGNSDTDTKPIEVLRTPAIIDVLSGRQKENRKQTLSASIATNPNHPLRTAWMELTEKATGETVRLYPDGNPVNGAHIKTRAIEKDESSDAYFTKLAFPFLTKWGDTREFTYTIYAEDTRGQTDTVTKDFTVVPDLPPIPEILLPTAFFREKGTNVARIEATDLSHSAESDPGDRLERAWYVSWPGADAPAGFTDAKRVAGYEELSFEAGKEIAFSKTGVGPVSVKLRLKDIWTDETLEEYVSDADYLTAESAVYDTVVDNIAPVVTLAPKPTKSADLLLLAASDAEYNNLLARQNEIDGALIEKGIDARIAVKKLPKSPRGVYSDFQSTRGNLEGNAFLPSLFALGEDALYAVSGTLDITVNGGSSSARIAAPYCITAYDAYADAVKWSVRAPEALADMLGRTEVANAQSFDGIAIGQDDAEKYLYLIVNARAGDPYRAGSEGKTFLFDKKTGAYVRAFDSVFGEHNYIANNSIYSLRRDGVYRYRTTGSPERVFSGEIAGESALFGGKARFFTQTAPNAYMADFDPVTEKTKLVRLSGVAYNKNNSCAGVDSAGALFVDTPGTAMLFDRAGRFTRSVPANALPVKNGAGRMTYAVLCTGDKSLSLLVYDLYTDRMAKKIIQTDREDGIYSDVLYGFDSGNGLVDVRIGKGANDLGSGWGDSYSRTPGRDGLCTVNMNMGEIRFNAHSAHMGYDDGRSEYALASDALYAVGWDLNSYSVPPPANDQKLKFAAIPRSEDQILARTTASLLTDDAKDIKTAIVVEDGTDKWSTNGAGFRAALGPAAAAKLSDSGAASLASAILQKITDAGFAPRKTTVIEKAPGAAAGGIERIFTLDPQKTYYYEYEAAGADEKEGQPLSIGFESAKAVPDAELLPGSLYVQKTYFEDFNGGPTTGFFGIEDERIHYKGDGTYHLGDPNVSASFASSPSSTATGRGDILFTVPAGVRGILSFDWIVISLGTRGSHFLIDGQVWDETGSGTGRYTHKYLLEPGPHSLTGIAINDYSPSSTRRATYYNLANIDNLQLDLVAEAPPAPKLWSVKKESAGGGWTRYSGNIETPSATTVYAAQPLEVFEGPYANCPYASASIGLNSEFTLNLPGKYALSSSVSVHTTGWKVSSVNFSSDRASFIYGNHPKAYAGIIGTLPFPQGATGVVKATGSVTGPYPGHAEFGNLYLYLTKGMNEALAEGRCAFDRAAGRVYFVNETISGTKFAFSSASDRSKIRGFNIWYLENGVKTYVESGNLESASEAAKWQGVNAAFAVVDEKPSGEEKEKGALIYKKGQLVAYNIGYADYENDPSKEGFWRYTHTPFNDGEHPDAAVILSKKGETEKVRDRVLKASIDRFQIDGKYVVEHWQRDNTDRTNAGDDAVDHARFNKYSNTETITFYIEGGGEAPWVTGIKTNPDPVKEGGNYQLEIGVDDFEKDDLTVIVEVYHEGKEVYRHCEEDIEADENGEYKTVVTGFAPPAEVGDYTVVVTVFDKDGTGLGDHSFTVVTEGRIEGEVMHTELWDENRKRYNRKLFGEEVNRASAFAEYAKLPAPRPRGANVFWSGERFMLRAGVAGDPLSVSCAIAGYPAYATGMTDTGRRNAADEHIYEGSIWQSDMINRWGRTAPTLLTFVFTAQYEGGVTKTHEVTVIVDTYEDYRQLHRYY